MRDGEMHHVVECVPRGHTERMLPMLRELLHSRDVALDELDAIAFGRGPGSFTGVRIATSAAQALGLASGVAVLGISTLAALAAGAGRRHGCDRVIACLDARMGEVYLGAFERINDDQWRVLGSEEVASPHDVRLPQGGCWFGVGHGFAVYGDVLAERVGDSLRGTEAEAQVDARDVAWLAKGELSKGVRGVPGQQVQPVYLRQRVAHVRER